jgi:hypothetical protein
MVNFLMNDSLFLMGESHSKRIIRGRGCMRSGCMK